jgi:hypothetical protein
LGVEIAKLRILARHSGDQILRYVQDAPLRCLRTDLGLPANGGPAGSLSFRAAGGIPAPVRARIRKLEDTIDALRAEVTTVAGDMVSLATGFARTDDRIFVQNTITAKVHQARPNDDGSTLCSWRFIAARRKGPGKCFRFINNLVNLPGTMLCEACLPTEHAIAKAVQTADLSGDEMEISGDEAVPED